MNYKIASRLSRIIFCFFFVIIVFAIRVSSPSFLLVSRIVSNRVFAVQVLFLLKLTTNYLLQLLLFITHKTG